MSGRGSLHCTTLLGQSGTNSQTCQTLYDFTGGHTLLYAMKPEFKTYINSSQTLMDLILTQQRSNSIFQALEAKGGTLWKSEQ